LRAKSRLNDAFFKPKVTSTTPIIDVIYIENALRESKIILGRAGLSCEKKSEPKNISEANH